MNALSIVEPYASLIANGEKSFETRSWSPRYLGELAICVSKNKNIMKASKIITDDDVYSLFFTHINKLIGDGVIPAFQDMQFGKCIAITNIVDIYKIVSVKKDGVLLTSVCTGKSKCFALESFIKELLTGEWHEGWYAWELSNTRKIYKPFPVRGKPGLFQISLPRPY